MPQRQFVRQRILSAGLAALLAIAPTIATACTRLVYLGANKRVIMARSMDRKSDLETNLWIFPRGMARSGEVGPNSLRWTSKYGRRNPLSLRHLHHWRAERGWPRCQRAAARGVGISEVRPEQAGAHGLGAICARQLRDCSGGGGRL